MKNKIELKLRKLLAWNFFGMFKTIFKWEGLEIEDIRQYYYWDDPRYINWKVSAKYGRLFVNVFRQERDIDVHLFVDVNKNFLWGDEKANIDKVKDFLLDFFIFAKKNWINVIGFLPDNKRIKVYRLWNDLDKLYFYIKSLEKNLNLNAKFYITNLKYFLELEKRFIKRHVILIISDFLDFQKDEERILKWLSYKNEIILVKIPISSPIWINYNIWVVKDKNNDRYKYILLT